MELRKIGIQPDILLCRCERDLPTHMKKKIALFCNVKQEAVIEAMDASTIYEVPLLMLREKLDLICHTINASYKQVDGTIIISSNGC